MSNTARQFTTAARSRFAPLGTALERARLTVVPRSRSQARRLPFVVLVSVMLLGGLIGLLMFNTSMQQAAFAEAKLKDQATALAARQQSMEMQVQALNDPQRIAAKAQAQGMVIPGAPALLHVPSGKVDGTPQPATRDYTPPIWPRNPAPHYAPSAPTTVMAEPTAGDTSATASGKHAATRAQKTRQGHAG